MDTLLNRTLLADNHCFGCGHANPHGLHIEVQRDPDDPQRLIGRFQPTPAMTGFPGITHGGVLYTAMDCLSTWVASVLGLNPGAAWVLRSANLTYHNPAPEGQALALSGWIKEQAGPWEPLLVQTETRRADGQVCVAAEFKVVPLKPQRLVKIAGIKALPENWARFLRAGQSG